MKTLAILTTLLCATLGFSQEAKDPVVLVPWQPIVKEAPLFFSVTAAVRAKVTLTEATTDQDLVFRVHQGKPELLSVALGGAGEVVAVTGEGLMDWSVRVVADGSRFLDLRPLLPDPKVGPMPQELKVLVKTRQALKDGAASLLLPRLGAATGMAVDLTIEKDPLVEVRVVKVEGLVPVAERGGMSYVGMGVAALDLLVQPGGLGTSGVELADTALTGQLAADGNSATFTLTTVAKAAEAGARLELCGGAALASGVAGDGWHLVLRKPHAGTAYDRVAEGPGDLPVIVYAGRRRKG